MAEDLVGSVSTHGAASSTDSILKSENVISKTKLHSKTIFKSLLGLQFKDVEKDFKIKELMEYLEIKQKRMLDLQMQNENLSQEVIAEMDHRREILSLIICQCQACEVITSHMQNLRCLGEQLKSVREELLIQNMENTKEMIKLEHEINSSFQEDNLELLNAVKEKLHRLQAENVEASSHYDEINAKITQAKMELENAEKELILMQSHYKEQLKQKDEENVAFQKEKDILNEKLTLLISKNVALEDSINSNNKKKKELEKQIKEAIAKRDSSRNTAIEMENVIKDEIEKQKDLSKEIKDLDRSIVEREEELRLKHTLLQQKKNDKLELEKQVQERDEELQLIHKEIQEAKEISHAMESDLNNLSSKIEHAEVTLLSLEEDYNSKISELTPMLDSLIQDTTTTQNEISSHQNALISLKKKVEEKTELNKLLQNKGADLKKLVDEEAVKIKNLEASIIEKEAQKEEIAVKLKEIEIMVEKRKCELENTIKLHREYDNEIQGNIEETRKKTTGLQEKTEKFESEINEKRKNLMEHLDVCRNDSLKLTNGIEAEIMQEKKEIADLKEKLQNTVTEMDSIKKTEFTKKCALVNKIKQLENELHLEMQAKVYKDYFESPASKSRSEFQQRSKKELPTPAKNTQREENGPASESDQSIVDISVSELMRMAKEPNTSDFFSNATTFSDQIRGRSTNKNPQKRKERDILDMFDQDF